MSVADQVRRAKEDFDAVYAEGVEEGKALGGYTEGEKAGFKAGKQAEYDAFWDAFQENGTRTYYANAFRSNGWSDINFRPKHNIKPTNANNMFTKCLISDFAKALGELEFDTSNATDMSFIMAELKETPRINVELNCGKAPGSQGLFYYSSGIETIDKIIVNENNTFSAWFSDCKNLKNITFEGVIGNNLNISAATLLTKKSITNIIEHLSYNASGKTLTLSQTAVDREFKGVSGADFTTIVEGSVSAEWIGWIASKSNWNISLV